MKSNLFYAVLALGVLLMLGVAWFGLRQHAPASPASQTASTSAPAVVKEGSSIYSNGVYGFTIAYPAGATLEDPFKAYYHLPSAWRTNALTDASGTPIIAVVGYRVDNTNTYPRYFDTEVRVGQSTDPREVARCLTAATEQNEQVLPDVVFGDTTFKAFSFADAAAMQYSKGVSYRAIHDGKCYAVEQVQTGSSYRDDPKSSKDIPDAELQQHYHDLKQVVESFRFAR
jgi:hypothetical protein